MYCISKLGAMLYLTRQAVKQIVHYLASEMLPGCLKAPLHPFQLILGILLLLLLGIATLVSQTHPHKALPPPLVKVVTLDMDNEVVQHDADAHPHNDDHVVLGVDKLDLYLLQRLEGPLQ
jgi:hypothetical protein